MPRRATSGSAAIRVGIALVLAAAMTAHAGTIREDFVSPPLECKSRPLWFWNGPVSDEATRSLMEASKELGYAGFGVLPAHDPEAFMTPKYLDDYAYMVESAAELGMKLCLYDEYWFPSGSAGGQLAKRYPQALSKRLDRVVEAVTGPAAVELAVPDGTFMGAVAMKASTKERVDLTANVCDGKLAWQAPAGDWRVMIFTCVTDGSAGLVDYLDPASVERFIELTYAKYYERLGPHFGATIDSAFFDEPTLYRTDGARTWTPDFNVKFERRFGYSPVPLYPAMWEDIGDDTAWARNALFGFRSDLYARGFMKTVNDWCNAHNIRLTGHQDQEEVVNPTGVSGDLIKDFKYQDIPGIDQIFQYDRAAKVYKVVSSAAVNYDRSLVMTECYGAIKDMPVAGLYKEAMDQFAKGVNMMIPHAVWYQAPENVKFPPELSHRTKPYAEALPAYNEYVGRLQRVLQHGRPEVDIAVLYPIATLYAGYRFGVGNPYHGEPIPEEADYLDVGMILSHGVRRDFTFLHPEILVERCSVHERQLLLNYRRNCQRYRVLILPGSTTISSEVLDKAREFYETGGVVIATTRLPHKSAERGGDDWVVRNVRDMFGGGLEGRVVCKTNRAGGVACFIKEPTEATFRDVLGRGVPVPDVEIGRQPEPAGGHLTYLHKVIDKTDYYFVANSGDEPVDAAIQLRGAHNLELWNPHTGGITPLPVQHATQADEPVTRLHVRLPAVESRFLVDRQN